MHPVLPHQRCQNHSETTIKAVKKYIRKGLVVSYYHTKWEWSLFVPFLPGTSIRVHYPLEKQWNTSILQSSRGPRSWTKTKEPQQAFLLWVCQRQTLQSSHMQRKGRRTAPVPAKIPALRSWCDKKSPTQDAHGNLCQHHDSLYSPSTCHLQQG